MGFKSYFTVSKRVNDLVFKIGWISSKILKTSLEKVMWKAMQQKAKGLVWMLGGPHSGLSTSPTVQPWASQLTLQCLCFLTCKMKVCVRPITITYKFIPQIKPQQTLWADSNTLQLFKYCITNIVVMSLQMFCPLYFKWLHKILPYTYAIIYSAILYCWLFRLSTNVFKNSCRNPQVVFH